MQAAVLDPARTTPAPTPAPLDLPPAADILYPDFPTFAASAVPDASAATPDASSTAPAPSFVIDSLAKADWAVSRILDAELRISRRSALAADLHARIDAWFQKSSASDNDTVVYITGLLRPYAESEIGKQRRSRTLLLPSGSVSLRKLADRLDIVDRDAALAYCEASHPDAVIVKKDLSRSALKTLIVSQGEAIPGCEFELGSDSLLVRPSDKA